MAKSRAKAVFTSILVGSLLCGPVSMAEKAPSRDPTPMESPLQSLSLEYGFRVHLVGTPRQVLTFKRWIDRIAEVPKGAETLWAISRSRHTLTIYHSDFAVVSSGRTGAPITDNLFNGRGEDVVIKFNSNIPEDGSHWVFDKHNNRIEYTAVQNLYHEFAHAMHMMTGTWKPGNSEGGAIREENIFRRELSVMENRAYAARGSIMGRPICTVGAYKGQELIC